MLKAFCTFAGTISKSIYENVDSWGRYCLNPYFTDKETEAWKLDFLPVHAYSHFSVVS